MSINDLFGRLADDGDASSGLEEAMQTAMTAASPLYGAGAWVNRVLHENGMMERRRLPAVVVSVGNITLGGTGKTPFCIWLIEALKRHGRKPGVLTRGYGREDENALTLVHSGRKLRADADTAGDEPVLLGKRLRNVPIVACANRYRGGRALLRKCELDTLVLDDGFQHHRLDRQADIVLVDATRPLSLLRLFPRGSMREPASSLGRAHLIVLTRWNQADEPKRVLREVKRSAPSVPIVRAVVEPAGGTRLRDGQHLPAESLNGKRVIVICGVGNPESVRQTVRDAGMRVVSFKALGDHEHITRSLLRKAEQRRVRAKADYVLVTEKDAVKITAPEALAESVVSLRMELRMLTPKDRKRAERVILARVHSGGVRGYLA